MAPGMAHCGGGEGPNTFDKIGTLDRWVEEGKAPESIVASHSHGRQDRSHTAPVPLSADGAIQGLGQHRRRGEFHLQAAVVGAIGPRGSQTASTGPVPDLSERCPRWLPYWFAERQGNRDVDIPADGFCAGLSANSDADGSGSGSAYWSYKQGLPLEAPTEPAQFRFGEIRAARLMPRSGDLQSAGQSDRGGTVDTERRSCPRAFPRREPDCPSQRCASPVRSSPAPPDSVRPASPGRRG